ncbi:LysR family transcriptional regulator [Psychrobacillus lasiicapitis]|uniref:LysR family transcriptional regulator n=1 Tax=Psychrobacillus lasiicapitis TaxID=1636719 RepID=A0A544TGT6_9BACI|nr:LysR family transcriptional regulator [Psychrobacillus lasiicapitis]TQR16638.1 LysR family transcriptional regulator [Psychrobacillus lasiicapitis]GGA28473.1 LysR family transcriptional regulator [Psychrobacillus lasiicapitis]
MHLDQISTFISVIESGSFNKASTKLFLSQPTITHRINKMESELGISLLVRGKKEVQLTKEGELFLYYAKEILESFQECLTKIELQKGESIINLGYGVSLSYFMMNKVINSISSLNYENRYHFNILRDIDIISNILENKIQMGFTRELLENDYLDFHLITQEPIYIVAGKKLGIKTDKNMSFKEIIGQNFIVPNKETLPNDFMINFLRSNNANIKYQTNDILIQKKLVLEGYGISYFSKECIIEELDNNNISQLQIEDLSEISSPIYLVYRKGFDDKTLENILNLLTEPIYSKLE